MKALAIAALAVLATAAAAEEASGADDALAWVQLLDGGKYEQSWNLAGEDFHKKVDQQRWKDLIGAVRTSLGEVVSRKVKDVEATRQLPGAPDGDYRVVEFATSFTHKVDAVETVVLAREAGGWKVDSYFYR